MSILLFLPIDAVPQGRPRFFKGHVVDAPKSRQFKKDVQHYLIFQKYACFPLKTPLKVDIEIYRSPSKFKRLTSRRYGDIDNLAKGIIDALNGIVWKDDSQIVELHVKKFLSKDTEKPHIDLEIYELID